MKRRIHLMVLGVLLTFAAGIVLTACQPQPGVGPTPQPTVGVPEPTAAPTRPVTSGGPVETLDDFIAALQADGARVDAAGESSQPFFQVPGKRIMVDGVAVDVFEYPDEIAREAASNGITPEGSPSPMVMVEWVDQPNFWAKGNLIILYVGKDQALIGRLVRILGPAITTQTGSGEGEPGRPEAVEAALAKLAESLNMPVEDLQVESFQQVTWRDMCLEIHRPNERCAAAETPGWNVLIQGGGKTHEVHTDAIGSIVRIKED